MNKINEYQATVKLSIDLVCESSPEWIAAVMADFDAFLIDHADCERKASSMVMSFIGKFPERTEIIPLLMDTAIEELEHFRDVYAVMEKRGLQLPKKVYPDPYINGMLSHAKSDEEGKFLDRMLIASIVECRGAERFRLVYENLEKGELKDFYHRLWASEAKHGHIFVGMALNYFEEKRAYKRLNELNKIEGEVLNSLELRSALH